MIILEYRGSTLKIFKSLPALFCIIGVLIFSQNCTQDSLVGFSQLSKKSIFSSNENAGTFDGKPDPGTYVRTFPESTCLLNGSVKNVQAVITVTDSSMNMIEDNCETVNIPISPQSSNFRLSQTNNKYFTYVDGIFEKIQSYEMLASNPLPISEAYCSFADNSQMIDVVIHTNESQSQKSAEIYQKRIATSGTTSGFVVAPFAISSQNSGGQIFYQSLGQEFNLNVSRSSSSTSSDSFIGNLLANIDGTVYQISMNCKYMNASPVLIVNSLGLVGRWSFDGPIGTAVPSKANSILDLSGLGNHGTVTGIQGAFVSYVAGNLLSGLLFDGYDDVVLVNHSASLNNLNALTANIWLNPSSIVGRTQILIGKTDASGIGWKIETLSNNGGFHLWAAFSGGGNLDVFTNQPATLSQWQNLTVTWDGSVNTAGVRFYVNGVEQSKANGSINGVGLRIDDTSMDLKMGGYPGASGAIGFQGSLDEPMLFNRVLTFDEIQGLVTHGPAALQ